MVGAVKGHRDPSDGRLHELAPSERSRLVAILAMLSSPYEGERATAALFATSFLASHKLMWADLTGLLQPVPKPAEIITPSGLPTGERRRGGARTWRGYCRRRKVAQQRHALDLKF